MPPGCWSVGWKGTEQRFEGGHVCWYAKLNQTLLSPLILYSIYLFVSNLSLPQASPSHHHLLPTCLQILPLQHLLIYKMAPLPIYHNLLHHHRHSLHPPPPPPPPPPPLSPHLPLLFPPPPPL